MLAITPVRYISPLRKDPRCQDNSIIDLRHTTLESLRIPSRIIAISIYKALKAVHLNIEPETLIRECTARTSNNYSSTVISSSLESLSTERSLEWVS